MSRRSNRVANFLRARGLKRGDHLLLLLGNVVPLWETMLAAMKLGVVVIPATTLLTPDELRDRLDRGGARAVVAAQDQIGKFAELGTRDLVRIVVNAPSRHSFDPSRALPKRRRLGVVSRRLPWKDPKGGAVEGGDRGEKQDQDRGEAATGDQARG